MIDLLSLLFHSLRYSVDALAKPSGDRTLRRLQLCTLLCCCVGTALFIWAVIDIIASDFRGPKWFWLLISSIALWCTAACIGNYIDNRTKRPASSDDT